MIQIIKVAARNDWNLWNNQIIIVGGGAWWIEYSISSNSHWDPKFNSWIHGLYRNKINEINEIPYENKWNKWNNEINETSWAG